MAYISNPIITDITGEEIRDAIDGLKWNDKAVVDVLETVKSPYGGTKQVSKVKWLEDSEGKTYHYTAVLDYIPDIVDLEDFKDYDKIVKQYEIKEVAKTGSYNSLKDLPKFTVDFADGAGSKEVTIISNINLRDLLGRIDLSKLLKDIDLKDNATIKPMQEEIDDIQLNLSRAKIDINDINSEIDDWINPSIAKLQDEVEDTSEGLLTRTDDLEMIMIKDIGVQNMSLLPHTDRNIVKNIQALGEEKQNKITIDDGLRWKNGDNLKVVEWATDGGTTNQVTGLGFTNIGPEGDVHQGLTINTLKYDPLAPDSKASLDITPENKLILRPDRIKIKDLGDGDGVYTKEECETMFQHILPTPKSGEENWSLVVNTVGTTANDSTFKWYDIGVADILFNGSTVRELDKKVYIEKAAKSSTGKFGGFGLVKIGETNKTGIETTVDAAGRSDGIIKLTKAQYVPEYTISDKAKSVVINSIGDGLTLRDLSLDYVADFIVNDNSYVVKKDNWRVAVIDKDHRLDGTTCINDSPVAKATGDELGNNIMGTYQTILHNGNCVEIGSGNKLNLIYDDALVAGNYGTLTIPNPANHKLVVTDVMFLNESTHFKNKRLSQLINSDVEESDKMLPESHIDIKDKRTFHSYFRGSYATEAEILAIPAALLHENCFAWLVEPKQTGDKLGYQVTQYEYDNTTHTWDRWGGVADVGSVLTKAQGEVLKSIPAGPTTLDPGYTTTEKFNLKLDKSSGKDVWSWVEDPDSPYTGGTGIDITSQVVTATGVQYKDVAGAAKPNQLSFVKLTTLEYATLTTKDPDTLYMVVD